MHPERKLNYEQKKKKGLSPLVGLAILFIFGILCIIIGLNSESDEPAPATTESVAQATTQATTQSTTQAQIPQSSSASDAEKYQTFIELAEESATSSFGNNHSIKKDGSTVLINVWGEGIAADVVAASEGNQDALNAWNDMKESMEYTSKSLYKAMKATGINDGHVVLSLLNDKNMENTLITYYDDGDLVYDTLAQ